MKKHEAGQTSWWAAVLLCAAATVALLWLLRHAALSHLIDPWYQTRSFGLVAYVLLWLALCVGLAQSGGLLKGLSGPVANVEVHDYLSVLALYATFYHMLILLWDHYVGFTLSEILIPFASHYQTGLLGLGGIAFYIMLLSIVTTYFRGRLGAKTWRVIHQASAVSFIFAWFHGVGAGTDFQINGVSLLFAGTGLVAMALLVYRVIRGGWGLASTAGRR